MGGTVRSAGTPRPRPVAPLALAVALALAAPLTGACTARRPGPPVAATNTSGGVAVHGHDPVAYFTSARPTPGLAAYTREWRGATYRFASAANAAAFAADPERFAPRYGGYCAYAMSLNRIADVDPERWAIVDGRLYLNANLLAQELWELDESDRIEAADRYWPAYPKASGRAMP